MKCLTCVEPGNFQYTDAAPPVFLKGYSFIKVKRIGICGTDMHAFNGKQPFFIYPRILGHELAGEFISGDDAHEFVAGEAVTIIPYFNCGKCIACRNRKPNCCAALKVFGVHIDGGMREVISVPTASLVKSEGLSYDALTLVEPFSIGAHGVRRAALQPGEFVLVIGAGPIGLGTMEFARIAGATVIALDINSARLQFCENHLKIKHTINAGTDNVLKKLNEITNGDMPTVVIDATGNQNAINNALQYLAHGGRFVLIGLQKEAISFSHPEFHKREATLMSRRNATREDFMQVIKCIKDGRIDPAIYITHRVKFENLKQVFERWMDPATGVIKAVVELV